jgi:hypothetical protein
MLGGIFRSQDQVSWWILTGGEELDKNQVAVWMDVYEYHGFVSHPSLEIGQIILADQARKKTMRWRGGDIHRAVI